MDVPDKWVGKIQEDIHFNSQNDIILIGLHPDSDSLNMFRAAVEGPVNDGGYKPEKIGQVFAEAFMKAIEYERKELRNEGYKARDLMVQDLENSKNNIVSEGDSEIAGLKGFIKYIKRIRFRNSNISENKSGMITGMEHWIKVHPV
ncbi:MAG: hypothetical protein ABEJ02_04855 [Candidatus Paceibacteria bacterium]